jgi:hypothetical protein
MKSTITTILSIIIILFLIIGCEPTPETEPEEPEAETEEPETQRSECDSYSEGPRKIMCYAMEAEDITMCDDVIGRFRDSCVVALAELVYDTSLVNECDMADAEENQKICIGLMAEDIDKCFDWGQGEGLGVSLSVRDCIDLTARKMRDTDLCDTFKTRQSDLMYICGDTGDCEGQWIAGAEDHAQDCKYAVEEAISYTE